MKTIALSFLITVLAFKCLLAQQLTPPIQNYTSTQYSAASQNWSIAIDPTGVVYAANNDGLLIYDGQQWELKKLSVGSIIRSVFYHQGKVYTGSYQEFGFWSRDRTGSWNYKSLMPLLKGHTMQNEEIWEIKAFRDDIYFRSFGAIYKYDGQSITPVKNLVTNAMVVFEDELIISAGEKGLQRLNEEGELVSLKGQEVVKEGPVIDFQVDGNQLLLGTRTGLYIYSKGNLEIFPDAILNQALQKYELNHILKISENIFAFATVKNGVIHYNRQTGKIDVYNRSSGLQNNTVLGMALHNGKLWIGLDNGIDVINLDSPITFYTNNSGELGAVYDLTIYKDRMYLASNTGVYKLTDDGPVLLEGAEGHSWNLEIIDGELFSNHNRGTFRIKENSFIPIEERTGSFSIVEPPEESAKLLIGTYTGLSVYSFKDQVIHQLDGVNFPVKKIVFENPNVVWAAHPYEGLYRIGVSDKLKDTIFVEKIKNHNKAGGYKADIFKIKNQIAILLDNQWYKYNALLDSISPFEELKDYKNHRLLYEDRLGYWFTNTSNNSLVFTNFKEQNYNLAFQELNERLVKGNESLIKENDSVYYVTLNDGFGRINLNELVKAKTGEKVNQPVIVGISDTQGQYALSDVPTIPFKYARDVNIRIALPDSDALELRYGLQGTNEMTGKVVGGSLNFQNLSYGEHHLKLFAINSQGKSSDVTHFNFEILPPWYLSRLMKVVYLLLFLGLIGLVFWYNKRKLRKHQEMLEIKYQEEHEERLRILEREQLVHEINSKRKELANTTMLGAKKNEVLMEIQGELSKDKDKFSNQFRLKHIMNKINHAIKSKDEWKIFETNFNELHEDFSKELLKSYPQLSNKDLKLCSYLKMNMSSKEIAPLMGISVRGVEVHRYRLRKKMNLDSKDNLTNFLIKNF